MAVEASSFSQASTTYFEKTYFCVNIAMISSQNNNIRHLTGRQIPALQTESFHNPMEFIGEGICYLWETAERNDDWEIQL